MNRRQFLQVAASTGGVSFAGCVSDGDPNGAVSPTESVAASERGPCGTSTPTHGGPQSPYDSLTLHQMPAYVTEYAESVVVRYREIGAAAQRSVQQALVGDGTYRECSTGQEQTDVMALFSHIERRWEQTGGESFAHTYLLHEGTYYGISLVQEGDFIRVKSIPCTAEACPTTPTPPA